MTARPVTTTCSSANSANSVSWARGLALAAALLLATPLLHGAWGHLLVADSGAPGIDVDHSGFDALPQLSEPCARCLAGSAVVATLRQVSVVPAVSAVRWVPALPQPLTGRTNSGVLGPRAPPRLVG